MDLLGEYGSDSEDDANTTTQEPTTSGVVESSNSLLVGLPAPKRARISEQLDDLPTSKYVSKPGGLVGSRLRGAAMKKPHTDKGPVAFVSIDADAVAAKERELAKKRREEYEIDKECAPQDDATAVASKKPASKKRSFASFLPAPKRSATVELTIATVESDDEDEAQTDDANSTNATPSDTPSTTANNNNNTSVVETPTTTTLPTVSSTYNANLGASIGLSGVVDPGYNTGPSGASYALTENQLMTNPRYDPQAEAALFQQAAAMQHVTEELPMSFMGRNNSEQKPEMVPHYSQAALLKQSKLENEMEAPEMDTPQTGFMNTASARKRGQIGYLAHVALVNKKKLEEQWRQGGHAKKMSRQKYGF